MKKYEIPYLHNAKQETLNQVQKDQEERSAAELLAEEKLQKANQIHSLWGDGHSVNTTPETGVADLCVEDYLVSKPKLASSGLHTLHRKSLQMVSYALDDTDDDDDYDDDFYDFASVSLVPSAPSTIPDVDIDLPLEEADLPSFSDDSILRGIESDRDSGEDTTSIDDLPLDGSIILSESRVTLTLMIEPDG
ncbi:hypothetical protein Tco_0105629 [Tanacetum coccineum]